MNAFNRNFIAATLLFGLLSIPLRAFCAPVISTNTISKNPWEIETGIDYGFINPVSYLQVREYNLPATPLHLNSIGLNDVVIPEIGVRYHFDSQNSLKADFRYFDMSGQTTFSSPPYFNGTLMAAGVPINTNPAPWYSAGLYYERDFSNPDTPWKLKGFAGLEYTFLYFAFDSAHAPLASGSPGAETAQDFHLQELPMPTIGLSWTYPLPHQMLLDITGMGNWMSNVNSLRQAGSPVFLSQSGFEFHGRLSFPVPHTRQLKMFVGAFYYFYRQNEVSSEDGNYILWSAQGPELGLTLPF